MIHCPTCGSGLRFDIASQKTVCDHCRNSFEPESLPDSVYDDADTAQAFEGFAFMCPDCGAELMTTDSNDAVGFCPYCGGASVIHDRLRQEWKPNQIIPFSITKEQCKEIYVKEVKNYVHQDFFEAYRDYSGSFSDSIIRLGVESMGLQNTGFLAKSQQVQQGYNRMVTTLVVDDYWKAFVQTYLGTKYMPQASASLTNEAVTMLQWLYDHNEMKESALLDAILGYADVVTLKSYLHTMLNDHFAKTDINIVKFSYFGRMLPMLGSDMDANTARGLMQHFIKPICKDSDCAAIILSNKDFYLAIMYLDTTIAASLVKEIVDLELYAEIAGELREMLPREKKEKI